MYLEIVTPEAVLISAEVDSVTVPGIDGEFQMLNNHAPIVSVLTKGVIKVVGNAKTGTENISPLFKRDASNKILSIEVKGGVLEMKDNKVIVLAD